MTDDAGRPGPGALSHATATVGPMGKQNRARRAAKARARQSARRDADARQARSSRAAGPTGGPEPFATDDRSRRSEPQRATDALLSAAHAQVGSSRRIRASEDLLSMSAPVVDRAAEELALTGVSAAWGGGWQPSELARHLRLRGCSAATGRLGRTAIAADHAGRSSSTLDSRWAAQVQAMELPDGVRARGWIRRWSDEERIDRSATLDTVVDLLVAQGQAEAAAEILGAIDVTREQTDMPVPDGFRARWDVRMGEIRSALGDDSFQSAWVRGRVHTMSTAWEFALRVV